MAINYTNGPQIPLDKPFSRFNGTPVDPDQIWDTYANAENYAKTAKAYVGQRLYVMGPSDKKGSYVIIDTNGTLKKLLDEDDKDSINSGDSNNNGDSTTIVTTNGNKSLVFDNKSDLDAWLEGTSTRTDELTKDDLISGDLLLITEENTPDYFWNGTQILEIESNDTSGYNKILDYITYEINNNEVTITECDTSISGVHIIPNTIEGYPVTSIGDETFYNCRNLTSITIPNSVTSIGVEAFASCTSLTSITIPESVTNIGFSAFSGCTSLESITIPNSVTSIGYSAFYQCTSLTSIVIPSSVTSIGESTFEFCDNLINIIIPDNITSIYINAFNNCDNLTDVYYEGSEEEWNNIEIDENNEPLLNVTIHYNQKLVTKEETMYDISPWQPNTDYEVGDVVIATLREFNIGDPEYTSPNRTVIAKCVRQHTSDDTSFALDNHEKGFNVEDVWEILQETYAYYDALGRRIHNTYAIKEEVVGKQIDEGGEIFNDYDNNQARTPKSSARGEGTVAGGKGFPIFKLQSTSNLLNNNDYTLSFNKEIKDGVINYVASAAKNFTVYLYPSTYKIGLRAPLVNILSTYDIKVTKTYYNTEVSSSVTEDVIYTQFSDGLDFVEINENAFNLDTTDSLVKFDIAINLFAVNGEDTIQTYKDYICLYDTATTTNPTDSNYIDFCTTPTTGKYYVDTADIYCIKENDEFSVRIKNNYDNLGKVTNTSIDSDGFYVEVSNFTTGTATNLNDAYLWLPVMPEDWSTYDDPDTKTSLKATRKINAGNTYMDAAQYAEGSETYAIKYAAHAEGNRSVAAGRWSHAEGNGTYAAYGAHSEGLGTKAIGQGSHSEGSKTVSQGYYSHSEGCITKALGGSSHSEGYGTSAEGEFSHAEGLETVSSGKGAHSEGYKSTASGTNAHTEGNQTTASGESAHAEGFLTIASGKGAHSTGISTKASGAASFAGGNGSYAIGDNSVAIGNGCYANANTSIALGNGAKTHGYMSVAIGDIVEAEGSRAFALGERIKTKANNQFAIGKYNRPTTMDTSHNWPVFMVGYGTSESDRKNVFEVDRDGVATVGANPKGALDVATKQYVDNKMRFMTQTEFDDIDTSTLTAGTVVFITE